MNPLDNDRCAAGPADEDADAREFEAFVQGQDPLDIEAATRVARRRNGLDAAGEAELQAWLAADPRHAAAYEDMDDTFGQVQQLPDDDLRSLRAGPRDGPAASAGRRAWLIGLGRLFPQAAAAALAFAAVGGGWMGWDHWRQMPTFENTYATRRGQQLTARLPDLAAKGSTLQLDTATRAEARLYRDRREVRLIDGQAMFTVQADPHRPFNVWAGALHITVVGTRFSVRHTPTGLGAGQTVVSVEEGRVRVARASVGAPVATSTAVVTEAPVELTSGQVVTADDSGRLGPVASLPPAAVAPWREGRVSFDQTPLAQAVAEFERYGRTGLVILDPAVAAMPVGGSYSLRQFQRFAEALPEVLPVRLERRGDLTEIVAR